MKKILIAVLVALISIKASALVPAPEGIDPVKWAYAELQVASDNAVQAGIELQLAKQNFDYQYKAMYG